MALKTFWNGEPCAARKVQVTVATWNVSWPPLMWWRPLGGTVRDAVEVAYSSQKFYLDDEAYQPDGEQVRALRVRFGEDFVPMGHVAGGGWAKVTIGRGSPRWPHADLAIVPGTVVPRD